MHMNRAISGLGAVKARVIVLDQTVEVCDRARRALQPVGGEVTFAGSVHELGVALTAAGPFDLLIVNIRGELGAWHVAQLVRRTGYAGRILALADDPDEPSVACLRQLPRTECVAPPQAPESLDALVKRAASEALPSQRHAARRPPAAAALHGIVGKSKQILELFSKIERVGSGDANVCIHGESGTGKELVARAIHQISGRRDRPFVTLDCTTIPEGLMESQLFGHARGAFTGAVDEREGVFALAHTGTLFIDELGELDLPLQAKLLRVIQNREFLKVGGIKPLRTDIRLITATNKDPKKAVENRSFREDLYYRVAVVMLKLPPLRERREDIPLLVEHFLEKFSAEYGKAICGIDAAAMDRLIAFPWPGNVRQLENFIEQAVVLAESDTLGEQELFAEDQPPSPGGSTGPLPLELGLRLGEVERRYILRTLGALGGNRTAAAKSLGISVRCLQYKLKEYALETETADPPANGAPRLGQDLGRWMRM
jgi:two-component system, NtrC family, response regulator AtoC